MRKVADCSFVHFVYPFLFDTESFAARVKQLDAAMCKSETRANRDLPMWQPLWKEKGFPRDDMLASVADFLNPKDSDKATARVWKLNDSLDEAFGLAERAAWELLKPGRQKGRVIPFHLGESGGSKSSRFAVQLALFRVGVGFLTVRATPDSEDLDEWLTFISRFRFVKGQRKYVVRATKSVRDAETQELKSVEFFPPIAAAKRPAAVATSAGVATAPTKTTAAEEDDAEKHFIDILDALLRSGSLSEGEEWWTDVFIPEQLIPFAALYVDEETETQAIGELAAADKATSEAHDFAAAQQEQQRREDFQLIYMLRNFYHPPQGTNPAPEDLGAEQPAIIPYAERCWFIFSLDGGSFLACDAPQTDFFRHTMPDHLRDQYYLLLLIVLHQRFTLMSLSQDVATKWLTERDEEKRIKAFRSIRDRLLDFTAHGLFTQVMQREHHHRCYRKWQEVFQIQDLYEEVRDEVREMNDYLQTLRTEQLGQLAEDRKKQIEAQTAADKQREREAQERATRLERIIGLIGICFGVPALVIGFLGINLAELTTGQGLKIWQAVTSVLGVSAVSVFVIWLMLRKHMK